METQAFLHRLWRGWSLALFERLVAVYGLDEQQAAVVEQAFFKVNDWRVVFEPAAVSGNISG
jgi:hypothetical protein